MKTINTIKTLLLTGVIAIFVSMPVMADSNDPNILTHYTDSKGNCVTVFKDKSTYTNCDVNIQSMDWINNTITIEKDGQLYSFYDDNVRNYHLNEEINVTFNDSMEIIECAVLDEPKVYKTQLIYSEDGVACFKANDNVYSFNYNKEADKWLVGDKCVAIIQNDEVLEVNPIPLAER